MALQLKMLSDLILFLKTVVRRVGTRQTRVLRGFTLQHGGVYVVFSEAQEGYSM